MTWRSRLLLWKTEHVDPESMRMDVGVYPFGRVCRLRHWKETTTSCGLLSSVAFWSAASSSLSTNNGSWVRDLARVWAVAVPMTPCATVVAIELVEGAAVVARDESTLLLSLVTLNVLYPSGDIGIVGCRGRCLATYVSPGAVLTIIVVARQLSLG